MKQLVFILLILFTSSVFAKEEFFEQRYRGWLWFDQQMKPQETNVQEQKSEKSVTKEEMLNPSWYEIQSKGRRHKGYKGCEVSHRALQI